MSGLPLPCGSLSISVTCRTRCSRELLLVPLLVSHVMAQQSCCPSVTSRVRPRRVRASVFSEPQQNVLCAEPGSGWIWMSLQVGECADLQPIYC